MSASLSIYPFPQHEECKAGQGTRLDCGWEEHRGMQEPYMPQSCVLRTFPQQSGGEGTVVMGQLG